MLKIMFFFLTNSVLLVILQVMCVHILHHVVAGIKQLGPV